MIQYKIHELKGANMWEGRVDGCMCRPTAAHDRSRSTRRTESTCWRCRPSEAVKLG